MCFLNDSQSNTARIHSQMVYAKRMISRKRYEGRFIVSGDARKTPLPHFVNNLFDAAASSKLNETQK